MLLAGIVLFVAATAMMQVIAHRNSAKEVPAEHAGALRPEVSNRALTHWRNLLLLERDLFLAGFTDDALLVFSDMPASEEDSLEASEDPAPQRTFSGIAAISEAWEEVIQPFIIAQAATYEGVTVDVEMLRSEARRVEAILIMRAPNPDVSAEGEGLIVLEMRGVARLDEYGSIFEERLETISAVAPQDALQ